MDNDSYFLIKKQPDHGWSITRSGQKLGTAGNVVEAIDLANRLAERDYALYQRRTRVVFVEDEPKNTSKLRR